MPYLKYYTPTEINTLMALVKAYLLENLDDKHTYKNIAEHFRTINEAINYNFLKLHSDSYFKMSINEFLLIPRLEKAKELLKDNTNKLLTIAPKVGMTPPTLCRKFREEYEMTPGQYKILLRKGKILF